MGADHQGVRRASRLIASIDAACAMPSPIRLTAAVLSAWFVLSAPPEAMAQSYPDRPIPLAWRSFHREAPAIWWRAWLAQSLSARVGQPVIVENRPGSNGNVAGDFVAHAAPDGCTLLAGSGALFDINPHVYAHMPFDPLKDLVPVATLVSDSLLLVENTAPPPPSGPWPARGWFSRASCARSPSADTSHCRYFPICRSFRNSLSGLRRHLVAGTVRAGENTASDHRAPESHGITFVANSSEEIASVVSGGVRPARRHRGPAPEPFPRPAPAGPHLLPLLFAYRQGLSACADRRASECGRSNKPAIARTIAGGSLKISRPKFVRQPRPAGRRTAKG